MKLAYSGLYIIMALSAFLEVGCGTSRPPLPTPGKVDLPRFMGGWYVVGYTPILVDKGAHNAVEHYARDPDNGRILTTYQFRKGSFDGPLKTYTPTGFVENHETGAEWKMQFIWPFKADYVILYLSEDYQRTIIAHPNRKYAWIMQRTPEVNEDVYAQMLSILEKEGFNPEVILRVPHDWTNEQSRLEALQQAGRERPLVPR